MFSSFGFNSGTTDGRSNSASRIRPSEFARLSQSTGLRPPPTGGQRPSEFGVSSGSWSQPNPGPQRPSTGPNRIPAPGPGQRNTAGGGPPARPTPPPQDIRPPYPPPPPPKAQPGPGREGQFIVPPTPPGYAPPKPAVPSGVRPTQNLLYDPTKRRRAVHVAISYKHDEDNFLPGCWNDAKSMVDLGMKQYGFKSRDIKMLTDEDFNKNFPSFPTKKNMMNALKWLIEGAQPGDTLLFTFSGHGGQVKDLDGDEIDGQDETLVPVDYEKNGEITDDELADMVAKLPRGVRLIVFLDCCHSGTGLDLPYHHNILPAPKPGQQLRNHLASRKSSKAMQSFIPPPPPLPKTSMTFEPPKKHEPVFACLPPDSVFGQFLEALFGPPRDLFREQQQQQLAAAQARSAGDPMLAGHINGRPVVQELAPIVVPTNLRERTGLLNFTKAECWKKAPPRPTGQGFRRKPNALMYSARPGGFGASYRPQYGPPQPEPYSSLASFGHHQYGSFRPAGGPVGQDPYGNSPPRHSPGTYAPEPMYQDGVFGYGSSPNGGSHHGSSQHGNTQRFGLPGGSPHGSRGFERGSSPPPYGATYATQSPYAHATARDMYGLRGVEDAYDAGFEQQQRWGAPPPGPAFGSSASPHRTRDNFAAGRTPDLAASAKPAKPTRPPVQFAADVILISGCKDEQCSADTFEEGRNTGAMTFALHKILAQFGDRGEAPTWAQLIAEMTAWLQDNDYEQLPQLSSSFPMDPTQVPFLL